MSQIKPDININSSNAGNAAVEGKDYLYTIAPYDGITDAQPQIMADFAYCIANGIPELRLHSGNYKVDNPIFLSNVSGGIYNGFTIKIKGEAAMWGDNGTFITATFRDRFILGIQRGKGVQIEGIHFRGLFVPPATATSQDFYNMSFASFTDGVSRDSRFSPYAALVIDPFTNSNSQIPSDGGYPGMASYYFGDGSQNGSTAILITNCQFESVVVGICSAPNGYTRNAENTTIQNVQFKFNKVCLSGGQDQEKNNRMINFACWYYSHTIFATGVYGADGVGDWDIEGGNLAGRVNTFISSNQAGFFPQTIKNIYAESLGKWGNIANTSSQVTKVENCKINFARPDEAGMQVVITGQGQVVYDGCTFRYYGQPTPLLIQGDIIFKDCNLGGMPVFTGSYIYPTFVNCFANKSNLGTTGIKTWTAGASYFNYGDWTIDNYGGIYNILAGYPSAIHNIVSNKGTDIYATIINNPTASVAVSGTTASFSTSSPETFYNASIVSFGAIGSNLNFGLVTAISGNTVTVSYVPPYLSSGTYNVISYHPVIFFGVITGDITSGQNTISNCKASPQWGGIGSSLVGSMIKNPYGGSKYLKITAVSGTTITFYGSITTTKTGAVFGNYTQQIIYTDNPSANTFPAGYIVRRGDKIIAEKGSDNSTEYIVIKGGFLSGDTDIRQSQLQIAY